MTKWKIYLFIFYFFRTPNQSEKSLQAGKIGFLYKPKVEELEEFTPKSISLSSASRVVRKLSGKLE